MSFQSPLLPIIESIRSTIENDSSHGEDVVTHDKLLTQINSLLLAAEKPVETIYRIGHQPWQDAVMRICMDLEIFKHLVDAGENGINAEQLATKTGADKILIVRFMRVLLALGMCEAKDSQMYHANSKTTIMTEPLGVYACKIWFDINMPTATSLPKFFRERGYKNPEQSANSAFEYTFGSDFWTWIGNHADHLVNFNGFMGTRRKGRALWFESYAVKENLVEKLECGGKDPVALIDIGGNRGHDLVHLRDEFPDLKGKLVLQDLPHVLEKCDMNELEGIQVMPHDFFGEQPVKGARAYHFRAIFHDWADEECKQILRQTANAMKPGYSKLLISEFILSDSCRRTFPASLDIQMMALHAGMERSDTQWTELLSSAGLKIVKIWQKLEGGEGVIEAELE